MEERLQDIIENSQIILGFLTGFDQVDSTPQGRMIAQCKWFIEQIKQNKLLLPVSQPYTSTLEHVHAEGYLQETFKHDEKSVKAIRIAMYRLLKLTKKGKYLLKPIYRPYVLRCLDALIFLLQNSPRQLNSYEQGSVGELQKLRELLIAQEIDPPLMVYAPYYKNLIYAEDSLGDMPQCKLLLDTVTDLLFEAVRPDDWLTPEDADFASLRY